MSPSQFTQEFALKLRAASPELTVKVKAELEVEAGDTSGTATTAYLDNAYKAYLQEPNEGQELMQRYISSLMEALHEEAKVNRARIVPIIKDREWLAEIAQSLKQHGTKKPVEHVFEDYNEQLVIVYAEDNGKNIRYLVKDNLAEAGISRKEIRNLAIDNLEQIIPKIEMHKGPLVSTITAGGDYDASLLLLSGIWTNGTVQVDGDIIVAIPARDLLMVTGTKNPDGIAKMRELAAKYVQESAYPLTDTLFVYRNGNFGKLAAH